MIDNLEISISIENAENNSMGSYFALSESFLVKQFQNLKISYAS